VDKIKETGLHPVQGKHGIYFEEARLVLGCRKIYTQDVDPTRFLDPAIDGHYGAKDYHRMYLGEIMECLEKNKS
jgi:hypothetical protein